LVLGAGSLAGVVLTPRAVAHAKFPERAIRLIIPRVPGSVSDAGGQLPRRRHRTAVAIDLELLNPNASLFMRRVVCATRAGRRADPRV